MGNSFASCYVHYVFATKNRRKLLNPELRERLFPYFGGIACTNNFNIIIAGGVEDHVHLLVKLNSTTTIAQAIQYLKGGSSKWIHEQFSDLKDFAWQTGYGAFTVSPDQISGLIRYIENQAEHHRKKSFREELVQFLDKYRISYEERYLL